MLLRRCFAFVLLLMGGVMFGASPTAVAAAATTATAVAEQPLTVFAAASLSDVLEPIGRAYTAATGNAVRFSFASSAVLARQIQSGAPADVFFSADQQWMDYLQARGLIDEGSRRDIVSNTLVLVAPFDSAVKLSIQPGFALAQQLGARGRLAVADPQSVPAGRYAQAALESLGVWNDVTNRLVPADNVRTALNFVARAEAPLGIVYGTDARATPKVRVVGVFPAASHPPITYPAAIVTKAKATPTAREFLDYLASPPARQQFDRAGFGPP
ncbi:MAG: molybdate ABC transporter substrate-binding protein [Nevskiaceae bacterium]|nr:molybdate ABC transporter substrate-binding protein [Nevskiaceae bacterium]